ncbi:MAG: hypothetical protein ACI9Z9_001694, partial [Litorivivens sp.]
MAFFDKLKTQISDTFSISEVGVGIGTKSVTGLLVALLILIGVLGFFWDNEPDLFDVPSVTSKLTNDLGVRNVPGSATVATTITLADILLHKSGGFLTNDIAPPGIMMDNVPSWEF